ncbi:endolytic transglycosylase MltG [Robertkochia marina]|uniref:Endolytic murein transglycosylase n=1 Tax=Robertkochia marina TaxID=1227945 RepID=A0A4S3M1K2_9FLAO|nr:endolytic transglycosylase MltG [Robertkochia marina]THD68068.1 endolytic transglycosylase MltG [Robertkochia marina]TRZ42647.1 endolytic transglycosylase MltG [Robertkochia marina]
MYIKKILLIIALLGVVAGGVFVYNIYQSIFAPNTAFQEDEVYLTVASDDTFKDVVRTISPMIKDPESFVLVAGKKGYPSNLKSGRFRIKKGMNNNEIINSIRSKNIPLNISFNNQERLEDLAGRVAEQIEADSLELLQSFTDAEFLEANGFDRNTALAMYIPNTYEFFWNTGADQFRDRMLKEYHRFWNDDRVTKAEQLNLSPKEVTSLAAIVQKETAKVDERPRVAGVYLNRIRKGMPLQADPTVIYALKRTSGDFDMVIKRVLNKDLQVDSPYNTYKYRGIPPGPIAMPDISSIDAVLNAESHNYLYFVADTQNFGYHKFAKTLSQHNENAREYRQWIDHQGVKR